MNDEQSLNDLMEFDHVIRVHDDGSVSEPAGIWAPTLDEDELDDPRWRFFSIGYTRQDGYNGPIMHNSESIGGQLARDILSTPGTYAAVVSSYSGEDGDENEDLIEGWAVVMLKDGA